jgi:hypothetical protein
MPGTPHADTILAHPALAGRVLYRRGAEAWAAHEIQEGGRLGPALPADVDPASDAWRGGPAR